MTDRHELEQRLEKAEWVLNNAGFRRCDIMACNCGSWHQVGGFKARFDEIKEAVEEADYSTNGKTLLEVVKEVIADAKRNGAAAQPAPRTPAEGEDVAERLKNANDYHDHHPLTGARKTTASEGPFNTEMPSSLNDACRRLDLAQERISQLEAQVEELKGRLGRINRGATAVLLDASLNEDPINPDVLMEIIKDACLPHTSTVEGGK